MEGVLSVSALGFTAQESDLLGQHASPFLETRQLTGEMHAQDGEEGKPEYEQQRRAVLDPYP